MRKWTGGQKRAKKGSYNQRSEHEPHSPGFLESPPTQAGPQGSLGAHWVDPASPGSRRPGTSDSGLASAEIEDGWQDSPPKAHLGDSGNYKHIGCCYWPLKRKPLLPLVEGAEPVPHGRNVQRGILWGPQPIPAGKTLCLWNLWPLTSRLGGSEGQTCTLSQFWKPEGWDQGVSGVVLPQEFQGIICFLSLLALGGSRCSSAYGPISPTSAFSPLCASDSPLLSFFYKDTRFLD